MNPEGRSFVCRCGCTIKLEASFDGKLLWFHYQPKDTVLCTCGGFCRTVLASEVISKAVPV